jgi:preprotein translocase subunit SecY
MPVYIGFIRGRLTLDLFEEKVRGWIYLIVGVVIYVGSMFLYLFDPQGTAAGWAAAGFIILLYLFFARIPSGILEIFGKNLTNQIRKFYRFTYLSAWFMAFFWTILIHVSHYENLLIPSILMCFFAFVAFYFEVAARRIVGNCKDCKKQMKKA